MISSFRVVAAYVSSNGALRLRSQDALLGGIWHLDLQSVFGTITGIGTRLAYGCAFEVAMCARAVVVLPAWIGAMQSFVS
jgi:uncharacterized membrane protein YedE/YeeE